jgi:hypothetical protein
MTRQQRRAAERRARFVVTCLPPWGPADIALRMFGPRSARGPDGTHIWLHQVDDDVPPTVFCDIDGRPLLVMRGFKTREEAEARIRDWCFAGDASGGVVH